MRRHTMVIDGMTTGGCVHAVRTALVSPPGVMHADVHLGSAQVIYDPAVNTPDALHGAVAQAGYALVTA